MNHSRTRAIGRRVLRLAGGAAVALGAFAVAAAAQNAHIKYGKPQNKAPKENRLEVGMLDCAMRGQVRTLLSSGMDLSCVFVPAHGGRPIPYFGAIEKFGIDIGVAEASQMQWLVLARADAAKAADLTGDYVGVSAEATVGVGVGANLLVRGRDGAFSLQPLSLQTQTGLNLAAGVTELELRSAWE